MTPSVSSPPTAPHGSLLASLYRDHQPWLLGRLCARLHNRADAEDVAAETFVQLAESGDAPHLREPRAFLSTIAKRVLFHLWRRQDLERAYLQSLMAVPEAVALSAEQRAQLLEAIERIDRALDQLPVPVKTAFLYSRLDGMRYPEIAQVLGVSLATVERYMKRALLQCLACEP
ncbi:sigma-70 family RNA polymerase sigma factor [Achromobacter sp. UBA2119]|uniref:sigma-70 family RNA polymerase sigma factor n=1 Tax=Achromobacter sp. UBA2119 TaxID=1945911 RepID=UPI00257DE170|nr:sigma-70 family RNA polymerase sigma factor [Achromobacter sp. UBA2119]